MIEPISSFQLTLYLSRWVHPIPSLSWQLIGLPAGMNLHQVATFLQGVSQTKPQSTALMQHPLKRWLLPLATTATSPSHTPVQHGRLSGSSRAPSSTTTCSPTTHRWRRTSSVSPAWWATVLGSLSCHRSPQITTVAWTHSHVLLTTGPNTSTITSMRSPRPFL